MIYTLNPKIDIITTFSASFSRKEFTDIKTYEFEHKDTKQFDSLWIGFNYNAQTIGELKPQLSIQSAILQKEVSIEENKTFHFKSHTIQGSLKGYSDPAIYSFYLGYVYNLDRKFDFAKITYGDVIRFGGDLSIVLSPKITLDLGLEQRFQKPQKIKGKKTSNLRSIPSYKVGSTYSLHNDMAISISSDIGGSSSAPDSIFSVSLWKKF